MDSINPEIFKNTEVAFASKSDKQLKKAHFLFKTMGSPWMNSLGTFSVKLGLNLHLPIKGLIKSTIFEQFCGGESIPESESTIALLDKYGIGTILDYSVEGEDREEVFEATKEEILKTITKSKNETKIPFCVFKPTGVGRFALYEKVQTGVGLSSVEQTEFDNIKRRIDEICAFAHKNDIPLFIDAEETWIQSTIDSIVMEMMARYNREKAIVYTTIQFYRVAALDMLKAQYKMAEEGNFFYGIKMVRGAYMDQERERAAEKGYPDPIHKEKKGTDQCYDDGIRFCAENHHRISLCAGTHNENSSMLLMEKLKEFGISKENKQFYFAQLLGMSDHISFNLSNAGYNVAKYVPYGPVRSVMPYLIRRAEENTSIAGQTGRELMLISKELDRRKGK